MGRLILGTISQKIFFFLMAIIPFLRYTRYYFVFYGGRKSSFYALKTFSVTSNNFYYSSTQMSTYTLPHTKKKTPLFLLFLKKFIFFWRFHSLLDFVYTRRNIYIL